MRRGSRVNKSGMTFTPPLNVASSTYHTWVAPEKGPLDDSPDINKYVHVHNIKHYSAFVSESLCMLAV